MIPVYASAAAGGIAATILVVFLYHRAPTAEPAFLLVIIVAALLGAILGGIDAILRELRAARRHQALVMDDVPGPRTGIKQLGG